MSFSAVVFAATAPIVTSLGLSAIGRSADEGARDRSRLLLQLFHRGHS